MALYQADCVAVMRQMPEASVDAIVTDPPYLIGFMGKEFDTQHRTFVERKSNRRAGSFEAEHGNHNPTDSQDAARTRRSENQKAQAWHFAWAHAALRVLKPGGHLLAFGGTRTHHRLACALEDAGFEIRDCLMWLYGSGFPKSLDVSKAIDKAAGAERMTDPNAPTVRRIRPGADQNKSGSWEKLTDRFYTSTSGEPATEEARPWSGWGTALKPAWEPIVLARKPFAEPNVAANVLRWGTGAINVEACRIPGVPETTRYDPTKHSHEGWRFNATGADTAQRALQTSGRWPANVVLDEEATRSLNEQSGKLTSGTGAVKRATGAGWQANAYGKESRPAGTPNLEYGDTGGASRFFYTAKADAEDRDGSRHPTVKPVDLCKWLVRLVTPPGGTVLDPFMGSGPIIWAARELGFRAIGIDRERDYCADAEKRLRQGVLPFS